MNKGWKQSWVQVEIWINKTIICKSYIAIIDTKKLDFSTRKHKHQKDENSFLIQFTWNLFIRSFWFQIQLKWLYWNEELI